MTALTPLALPASDATPEEALAWMERRANDGLAAVREQVDRLRGGGTTDAAEALRTWDGAMLRLVDVMAAGELFANVHPDEGVRTRAEKAGQEADTLSTDLRQDRELYDALAALDPSGLDATATRLLEKTLLDFRRSGVDREARLFAIKASGVPYDGLTWEQIVPISLDTGQVLDTSLRPSSDTPTHRELYLEFACGAIAHAHSDFATAFAVCVAYVTFVVVGTVCNSATIYWFIF